MEKCLKVFAIISCVIIVASGNSFIPSGETCEGIDVKFDANELKKLEGCGIVDGSLQISQLESFGNFSFPNLHEIIGRLVIYKVSEIKSISQLFPNLNRIHGEDLLENYAMILVDNPDLEDIGLTNLKRIKTGAVRIEGNEKLCYVNTIDWNSIVLDDFLSSNYFKSNQDPEICPKCPKDFDNCWNEESRQLKSFCNADGVCCDHDCLSCSSDDVKTCTVCRKNIVGIFPHERCVDACPYRTYQLKGYRCITKEECKNLNINKTSDPPFIASRGHCMEGCPAEYQIKYAVEGNKMSASCVPCKGRDCWKRCNASIVDSIESAKKLKGCQIISGSLEIQMKPTNNAMTELENSLSDIIEIEDYLKISRSSCISSLSFLKSLKTIRGKNLAGDKYSVIVFDNSNLRSLFQDEQEIRLKTGKVFFHFNTKLCYSIIEKFVNTSETIENFEQAKISNGDTASCGSTLNIQTNVVDVSSSDALIHWSPVQLENGSSVLSFVIFYKETTSTDLKVPQQESGVCGNDDWLTIDIDEVSGERMSRKLLQLNPFTQYAFYIKAYILPSKFEAWSDVKVFTTLPGIPEKVEKFKVESRNSSGFQLSWKPPKRANGELEKYELSISKVDKMKKYLKYRDFCNEPFNSSDTSMQETTYSSSEASVEILDFEGKLLNTLNSKKSSKKAKRESIYHFETVEAVESTQNEFSYGKLDHFSNYVVTIRACRKQEKTDLEETHEEFCSSEVEITTRTEEKEDADVIKEFQAVRLASNSTDEGVKLTWTPPEEPNGIVLNYIVKQTRIDNLQTIETICVSLLNRENVTWQVIDKMKPGNFSFQIAAVTMAGQGDFTEPQFVVIEAPSFFSIIATPSFLLLGFMSIASLIAVIAYNAYKRNSTSDILSTFDQFDSDHELTRN